MVNTLIEIDSQGPRGVEVSRRGDWMQTFSGRKFWPLDPRVEEVFTEDIAHALANQCRFGGHCPMRSDYGWLWESPGGKVNAGEDPRLALQRELMEEVQVDSVIHAALASFDVKTGGGRPVRLTFYSVENVGTPRPRDPIGLGWFAADEIATLRLTPGNSLFRETMMELCSIRR